MKSLKIWTEAYRPFILGGRVNAPIITQVKISEPPVALGGNISVHVIVSPVTDKTHVAEASTGALVGDSLDQVRKDFESADLKVIKGQLKEARKRREQCDPVTNDEFWRLLK